MVRAFRVSATNVKNKRGSESEGRSAQEVGVLDTGTAVADKRSR